MSFSIITLTALALPLLLCTAAPVERRSSGEMLYLVHCPNESAFDYYANGATGSQHGETPDAEARADSKSSGFVQWEGNTIHGSFPNNGGSATASINAGANTLATGGFAGTASNSFGQAFSCFKDDNHDLHAFVRNQPGNCQSTYYCVDKSSSKRNVESLAGVTTELIEAPATIERRTAGEQLYLTDCTSGAGKDSQFDYYVNGQSGSQHGEQPDAFAPVTDQLNPSFQADWEGKTYTATFNGASDTATSNIVANGKSLANFAFAGTAFNSAGQNFNCFKDDGHQLFKSAGNPLVCFSRYYCLDA